MDIQSWSQLSTIRIDNVEHVEVELVEKNLLDENGFAPVHYAIAVVLKTLIFGHSIEDHIFFSAYMSTFFFLFMRICRAIYPLPTR